jgi:hypothetical protein
MDESYFKERLSAYFDRSLPPDEMAMMDKYVRESAEARRILEEYRKLEELVEKHGELAGDDYWEKSAERIDQAIEQADSARITEVRPGLWRGWLWKAIPVAASLILLTFIGLHRADIFQLPVSHGPEEEPAVQAPKQTLPGPGDEAGIGSDQADEAVEEAEVADSGRALIEMPSPVQEVGEIAEQIEPDQKPKVSISTPAPTESEETSQPEEGAQAIEPATVSKPDLPDMVDSYGVTKHEPDTSRRGAEKKDVSSDRLRRQPGIVDTEEDQDANYVKDRSKGAEDTPPQVRRSPAPSTALGEDTVGITAADVEAAEAEAGAAAEASGQPEYTPDQLDSLLTYYRPRREQLEMQLTALKFPNDAMIRSFSATKENKAAAEERRAAAEKELRRQLFKACYFIALSTLDDEEFVEVVTVLKDAVRDREDPNRELARDYLDRLDRYLESHD